MRTCCCSLSGRVSNCEMIEGKEKRAATSRPEPTDGGEADEAEVGPLSSSGEGIGDRRAFSLSSDISSKDRILFLGGLLCRTV
jgi:hypothetical protein